MILSKRYDAALAHVAKIHRDQVRKGLEPAHSPPDSPDVAPGVPYLSHLMAVSGLVLEAGGSEDEAIAALLHDALEDQGDKVTYAEIETLYGATVARIVRACSDTEEQPKPPWRERKQAYLRHLEEADDAVLRVIRADKLHNARTIITDLRESGPAVWTRFSAPRADQLWYYSALADCFAKRLPGPHSQELVEAVERMASFAGSAYLHEPPAVPTGGTYDALLGATEVFTRAQVLARPSPVPRAAGLYAWYFDEVPDGVRTEECHTTQHGTLLYVGIAPKAPPASGGQPSTQTLRDRIRYHYCGNAEGSTLRLTLGCHLADQLGIALRRVGSGTRMTWTRTGEATLSEWMHQHARVTWIQHPQPWLPEQEMIRSLNVPLNLDHNAHNAYYSTLKAMRARHKALARALPIATEG